MTASPSRTLVTVWPHRGDGKACAKEADEDEDKDGVVTIVGSVADTSMDAAESCFSGNSIFAVVRRFFSTPFGLAPCFPPFRFSAFFSDGELGCCGVTSCHGERIMGDGERGASEEKPWQAQRTSAGAMTVISGDDVILLNADCLALK
jgi:hypothetical protein